MHKTPEITRLIHGNLWIVASFAFGRPVIERAIQQRLAGEWKYLNKTIHETAEIRADRALLEMATQLRVLDEAEGLSEFLTKTKAPPMGFVTQTDGTDTNLYFRDMTNKIIHGASFVWNLGDDDPIVLISPNDNDRWQLASVNVVALMGFVGQLMF
jgi:hypothetical protein